MIDLNALMFDITSAETRLRASAAALADAQECHEEQVAQLAAAQQRFDAAVLAVRGTPLPAPASAPAPTGIDPSTPGQIPMGPLPPTSPALQPGYDHVEADDEREDQTYDPA